MAEGRRDSKTEIACILLVHFQNVHTVGRTKPGSDTQSRSPLRQQGSTWVYMAGLWSQELDLGIRLRYIVVG